MPVVPLALFPCGRTFGEGHGWRVRTRQRRRARIAASILSWLGLCFPRRASFPWVEKERPQRSTPLKESPAPRLGSQTQARSPGARRRKPEGPRPARSVLPRLGWLLPHPQRQAPRRRRTGCATRTFRFLLCCACAPRLWSPLTRMAEDRVPVGKIESWNKHNEVHRNTCTLHANKRRFCRILHMGSISNFRIFLISYCSLDF